MKSLRLLLLQNCIEMTSPDTLGITSLQSPLQMRRCTARLWPSSISNGRMRTSYRWWKAKLYGCLTAMGKAGLLLKIPKPRRAVSCLKNMSACFVIYAVDGGYLMENLLMPFSAHSRRVPILAFLHNMNSLDTALK